jgi:hypothetical protein
MNFDRYNQLTPEIESKFLKACNSKKLDVIKDIIRINSSHYNKGVSVQTIDSGIDIIKNKKFTTKNQYSKESIIDFLSIEKIRQQFFEACYTRDIDSITNILDNPQTSKHIHFSEIDIGTNKCLNSLVSEYRELDQEYTYVADDGKIKFVFDNNPVYEYLSSLVKNYIRNLYDSMENNQLYFKTHLPDYIKTKDNPPTKHWATSLVQDMLYKTCEKGNLDIASFLLESPDLTLKPNINNEDKAFKIAYNNNHLDILIYFLNNQNFNDDLLHRYNALSECSDVNDKTKEYINTYKECKSKLQASYIHLSTIIDNSKDFSEELIKISQKETFKEFPKLSKSFIYQLYKKACKNGNIEVAKFLLFSDDITFNAELHSTYCFNEACSSGNLDLVNFLFSNTDFSNYSTMIDAIKVAASYGHNSVLEYLFSKNCDDYFCIEKAFASACSNAKENTLKYLIEKLGDNKKELNSLVSNVDYLNSLISYNIPEDAGLKSLELLVNLINKEEIETRNNDYYSFAPKDYTALIISSINSHKPNILNFLLSHPKISPFVNLNDKEVELFKRISTYENDSNMIKHLVFSGHFKETDELLTFFEKIKSGKLDNIFPYRESIDNLKENTKYTETLFAMKSLNHDLQSLSNSAEVVKKNKLKL